MKIGRGVSTRGEQASVIIPARNEARLLARCLTSVGRQTYPGSLRLIVVANACEDETAHVARGFEETAKRREDELIVLETTEAGKPCALNIGDGLVRGGPRIYLDADVSLSPNAIERLLDALCPTSGIHVSLPRLCLRRARSHWSRSYASVWSALPYVQTTGAGTGVYAVSAVGRERWRSFPPLHSDDKLVCSLFAPAERTIVADALAEKEVPEGLMRLVSARARWCRGNRELARKVPSSRAVDGRRYNGIVSMLSKRPDLWVHMPSFLFVYATAAAAAGAVQKSRLDQWDTPRDVDPMAPAASPSLHDEVRSGLNE